MCEVLKQHPRDIDSMYEIVHLSLRIELVTMLPTFDRL
jgi:hypothetical protein